LHYNLFQIIIYTNVTFSVFRSVCVLSVSVYLLFVCLCPFCNWPFGCWLSTLVNKNWIEINHYHALLLCRVALSCVLFLVFCFVFFSYLCTLCLYVRAGFLIGDVAASSASKFKKRIQSNTIALIAMQNSLSRTHQFCSLYI
jgi:hypothetical protein